LRAFSGASLSSVANLAWRSGLGGLEFASGIPGTLGGGISMNAGAYGSEMRDVVKTVTVLDSSTGELMEFENGALAFGYRTSRIQVQKDIIIVEAELELSSGEPREILKKMRELNRLRLLKQPLDFPNAGSTFKRPPGNYAGKLIEEAGLKGVRVGGAQVSRKHAGFLINLGYASAEDVLALISLIQREVEDKFGVSLEPEIKIVGEK
jgi:UDP-N-acetylmuramate dehydrogenase